MDYKGFARHFAEIHNKDGLAIQLFGDGPGSVEEATEAGLVLVNLTSDSKAQRVMGKVLNPKDVRRTLWLARNTRKIARDGSFLWSATHPEKPLIFLGFGRFVRKSVVDRALRMGLKLNTLEG